MTKKVMIWGASGGIGMALSALFLEKGWQIAAVAREKSRLRSGVKFFESDVSDRHRVEEVVYEAGIEFDQFDAWIYAAGDIISQKIPQTKEEQWQQVMDANLTGVFRTLRASLPLLKDKASVIVIGANVDRITSSTLSAYAAAKAGLEAFLAVAAQEDRRRKYLLVRPLAVDTPFWDKVPFSLPKTSMKPEQVAEAIMEALQTQTEGQLNLP